MEMRLERNWSLQEMHLGDWDNRLFQGWRRGKGPDCILGFCHEPPKREEAVCWEREPWGWSKIRRQGKRKKPILYTLYIEWYLVGSWMFGLELRRVTWLVIQIWEPYACRTYVKLRMWMWSQSEGVKRQKKALKERTLRPSHSKTSSGEGEPIKKTKKWTNKKANGKPTNHPPNLRAK